MNKIPKSTYIIAEAGVNHNGSLELAYKLIDLAADAKADAIKFQTFVTEELVTKTAKQANYQIENIGHEENQFEMLKKLELSPEFHEKIISYCQKKNVFFLSTAFDSRSVELLKSFNIPIWKIPSGEITNLPYLKRIGSYNKEIILSTGMATLGEVENALHILNDSGTSSEKITLLHCTTEYPAPYNEVNLRAMKTLGDAFSLKYGYSDHTPGIEVSIAAVALGASVIEKHFTIDKSLPGPDHRASLNPDELKLLVSSIRNIEIALGDGIKRPSRSESQNIVCARKSIVAARNINAGEIFSIENITTKRPGSGISPLRWDTIIGTVAKRAFSQDEQIEI